MTEEIVLELKLPVPVKELVIIAEVLAKIHDGLLMRQVGPMLQFFKTVPEIPLTAPR